MILKSNKKKKISQINELVGKNLLNKQFRLKLIFNYYENKLIGNQKNVVIFKDNFKGCLWFRTFYLEDIEKIKKLVLIKADL